MTRDPAYGEQIDDAVDDLAGEYVDVLAELVAVPSVAGNERPAQEIVAGRLERFGFKPSWLPLNDAISELPGAGRPLVPTQGREVLVARRGGASPTALVINGHIDVVPPGDERLWTQPPFKPVVRDGWLYGRGSADMKGGFAAALLALHAMHETAPESLAGDLTFVVALEEESSGNGTLATIAAGVLGDVALLPEPTEQQILVSGVGVCWCDIEIRGGGAHVGGLRRAENPLEKLMAVCERVRALESEFAALARQGGCEDTVYRIVIGSFCGGDWPSSVPAAARAQLRIGFPECLTRAAVEALVRRQIDAVVVADDWLGEHPPEVSFVGLQAEPHRLAGDHPLVAAVDAAHRDVNGSAAQLEYGAATTDARFYLNQGGVPAVCYGPRTRAMHGADEAVDLDSITQCARVYGRLIPRLLANPPEVWQ